jgi:hypothetical protein
MKTEQFDKIIEHRLKVCTDTLIVKTKEYVKNEDKLHNFKIAANTGGQFIKSKEAALWGMANKHLVSVIDIVNDCNNDPNYVPSTYLIEEKITDLCNYILLLECCLQDRVSSSKPF